MSENTSNYLNSLNESQREAVEIISGATLVLAGAGSGKTRVLTYKLLHLLIKKILKPSQILAVTFTNKAASEMKSRVSKMLNFPIDRMWLGTFHSLSLKILRQHYEKVGLKQNFIIIDTDDQIKLIKKICDQENIDSKDISPKFFASAIDSLKNKGIFFNELKVNKYRNNDEELRKVYKIYQKELVRINCVDFGDLILLCIKLFKDNKEVREYYQNLFNYILVDEYQDINFIQQKWLEYLYQGHKNICCVGDDDQSIYSWRGADVTNLLEFQKNFQSSNIIRLEQNYRSTKNILECASILIDKNKNRYGKKLWSENEEGEKIFINGFWETKEEAIFTTDQIDKLVSNKVQLSEIAILFRVSAHTRSFEERLIAIGLPYRIIGGLRFYERKEIKDVIAYLRLINNISDDLAFERVINIPKRGIGKTTLSKINQIARLNNTSMFEASQNFIGENKTKVNLEINDFINNILKWQKIKKIFDHIELAKVVLEDSNYIQYLENEAKNSKNPENLSRVDNINEFLESLKDFENLEGFLEHVGLVMENMANTDSQTISLMTMHGSKGLEFDYVFLAGWEEGVFPSQRSLDESGTKGLEEERRLAYVALTRARKKIQISYVNQNRYSFASHDFNSPSRFISELPKDAIELNDSKVIMKNDFLNDFIDTENISNEYLTPGRKRILENKKALVDWDFNQDISSERNLNANDRVFHKKFGIGIILNMDTDTANVEFTRHGIRKVYLKFLQFNH
ncbi:MAG: UvrD-helicase domain-containing protein [Pelagibacteraceae bacterium]|nr:UvrD-helicase domain-containing protein [Pelagibacteraceae bacterium]